VTKRRNVIVNIATSADGYIARPDGDLEWLTSRPAPKGFYGMGAFMKSIDTMVIGRKTYEVSLRMGAKFDSKSRTVVFSHHSPPADAPPGVEFVNGAIGPFVSRLRELPGKDIWLMGGGAHASFLDNGQSTVRHQRGPGLHRGWHSADSAASPQRAAGFRLRRTLRGRTGSTALPG
jgi:dihydrofolate reductase